MKKQKCAIVTGSNGLIGSQTVKFLIEKGYYIVGIDNDMRAYFFGEEASTKESEGKRNPQAQLYLRQALRLQHLPYLRNSIRT